VRILVIEDETKVARALAEGLRAERYQVTVAGTGEEGFYLGSTQTFDLVLLDLMLPGRDGIDILRALRARGTQALVLVLTARDAVDDRVLGLDCGADDYLVKPFAFPELLARIRALLRRGRPDQVLRLRLADLEMDLVTRRVTRAQRELALTRREHELLEFLLRRQGQLVSREMLAQDVWHEAGRSSAIDNVIDVHVMRLRRKVDHELLPRLIHTVRGVGFVMREGEP
jgi:DNA-binding response OmpR family regulator